jgi:dihydrofolate synthase/folylpolyglutamate synthase
MPRVYEKLKHKLQTPPIVHLIGTNGKGTTGRFLATALHNLGFSVGHYTSPHILEFNERIWLNGESISNTKLEELHLRLLSLLEKQDADALSYFEYTTFLAILAYESCDYIVLEAGLGGEHDATAVFPKVLTLVTPIDKDHEAFLGDTLESIATTKLRAVQNKAILAKQNHPVVYEVAKKIEQENGVQIQSLENYLNQQDLQNIQKVADDLELASYLKENLSLAIAALQFLKIPYTNKSFTNSKLFGRLTQFRENILLDVGHNTLAAQKIVQSLTPEKYVLVYNSYKDKNYKEILEILKPIILEVAIIDVNDVRIEKKQILEQVLDDLQIVHKEFIGIEKNKKYLVFGSFSVVEKFLKGYCG